MKPAYTVALTVLAIIVSGAVVLLPALEQAMVLVKDNGVACMWAIIGVFGFGFWQAIPVLRDERWWSWRGMGVAFIASVLMHLHYPHELKVFSDEQVLVAVSKSIHEERQIATPGHLEDAMGAVKIGYGYLDKRPYFFPFAVSLFHDFFGYRASNAVVLNALLTPLFLYLVFLVSWRISGDELAGLVAIVCIPAFPLFAHNVTGGGFEIMNVCLILILFLWSWIYSQSADHRLQVGLVAVAMLLAYTRYESILYLGAAVGVVAFVSLRQRKFLIHPIVAILPILLIPLGCIFRTVSSNEAMWFQLADKGSTESFALSYILKNIPPALNFFFSDDHFQTGSRWVGLALVPGVLFGLLALGKRVPSCGKNFSYWAPGLIVITVLTNFLVLLSYHWGQLDDPVVSRLAIPFIIFSVIITVWAARAAVHWRKLLAALTLLAGFSVYAKAIPTATKNIFASAYAPAREWETLQHFRRDDYHPDTLVLTDRPLPWVCLDVWTQNVAAAAQAREVIERWIRTGRYARVFVQQRFNVDIASGALVMKPGYAVPEDWTLEEVVRRRLNEEEVMTISRVVLPAHILMPVKAPEGEEVKTAGQEQTAEAQSSDRELAVDESITEPSP